MDGDRRAPGTAERAARGGRARGALRRAGLALPTLALAACAHLDYDAQDTVLARDPRTDEVAIELVYQGVAKGELSWERTEALIRRIADDAPCFLVHPWVLLDLEELADELAAPYLDDPELARRVRAFCASVAVVEARVHVDADGRLGIRQRVRVADASEALSLLSRWLQRQMLDDLDDARWSVLDAESGKRLLDEAYEGRDWLRWDGTAIELTLPLTERVLERWRAELAAVEAQDPWTCGLRSLVDGARVADGRVVLRVEPDPDGVHRWTVRAPAGAEEAYDTRLLERLRAADFPFDR